MSSQFPSEQQVNTDSKNRPRSNTVGSQHIINTNWESVPNDDPRSPTANISRTPVDAQTYHLPSGANLNKK